MTPKDFNPMPKSSLTHQNSNEKLLSHGSEKKLQQNSQVSAKNKHPERFTSDVLGEVQSTRSKTREMQRKGVQSAGQKVPNALKKN